MGALLPYIYYCTAWLNLGPFIRWFLAIITKEYPQIWCFLFSESDKERSYASLWLSGVKRKERKEKLFLSTEVSRHHFEVWGAAVCCTFLFARFVKVPHSLSWWASLGRPTHPPFELFKKQKSHAKREKKTFSVFPLVPGYLAMQPTMLCSSFE